MSWVHCNTCFVLASEGTSRFHLTSCGHVFCDCCIAKDVNRKCRTCGQIYNNAIPLSNQMKADVQMYFTDLKDLCKNAIKQIQQLQQVSEFQKGHSQRLSSFQHNKLAKAGVMFAQAQELERKYKHVLRENETLKGFVRSLGHPVENIVPTPSNLPKTPQAPKTPIAPTTPGLISKNFSVHLMASHKVSGQFQSSPLASPSMRAKMPSPMQNSQSNQRTWSSSQRGLVPTPPNQPSPRSLYAPNQKMRNTSMVTTGRISLRTPPVNGKVGPINSPMQVGASPRSSRAPYYRGSKIGQNLHANRLTPTSTPIQSRTSNDERRPIQLGQQPRAGLLSASGTASR